MVQLAPTAAQSGISLPKSDFRAVPAIGAPKDHLDRYSAGFANEPFMYAAIRKAYRLLEVSGVLAKLDIFAFTALTEPDGLMNWIVGGSTATNHGTTFSPSAGFKGNGDGAYINLGVNLSALTKFKQNSGHVGIYLASNPGPNGQSNAAIGMASASNTFILPRSQASSTAYRVCAGNTRSFSNPRHGEPGFLLANRTGMAMTRFLQDGDLLDTTDSPSVAPVSQDLVIGRNGSGFYGTGTYAAWSIGAGLTESEEQILNYTTRLLAASILI